MVSKKKTQSKKVEDDLSDLDISESVEDSDELEEKIKIEKEIKGEVKKKKIDQDLVDEVDDIMREEKPKAKKPLKAIKKPRKQTIIDKILDGYDKLNIPPVDRMSPAALKAEKVNILEHKLAQIAEKLSKEILKVDKIKEEEVIKAGISDDVALITLYQVNIMMAEFIETMAKVGRQNKEIKDYVPDLDGLTLRMLEEQKSKQLKECLKAILTEHGESIKPYLSPLSVWAMFMMTCATEQITENECKKLSNAIDKKKQDS